MGWGAVHSSFRITKRAMIFSYVVVLALGVQSSHLAAGHSACGTSHTWLFAVDACFSFGREVRVPRAVWHVVLWNDVP